MIPLLWLNALELPLLLLFVSQRSPSYSITSSLFRSFQQGIPDQLLCGHQQLPQFLLVLGQRDTEAQLVSWLDICIPWQMACQPPESGTAEFLYSAALMCIASTAGIACITCTQDNCFRKLRSHVSFSDTLKGKTAFLHSILFTYPS